MPQGTEAAAQDLATCKCNHLCGYCSYIGLELKLAPLAERVHAALQLPGPEPKTKLNQATGMYNSSGHNQPTLSLSLAPLAGHSVSMAGFSSSALASGVLPGSQNARISCGHRLGAVVVWEQGVRAGAGGALASGVSPGSQNARIF